MSRTNEKTQETPQNGEAKTPRTETIAENEKKWGKTVWKAGWTGIPTVLLDKQHTLKLSSIEFNVLIQIIKYWWYKEKLPRPSKQKIADAMGVSTATVRRAISKMVSSEYLDRIGRKDESGQRPNQYDFRKLISILTPYAKEILATRQKRKKEDEETRKRKKAKGT